MSVKISGLVWDLDLPRDEKYVLLAYVDHADHDGNNIYPANSTVMRMTGYNRRSIQTITKKLKEERGEIKSGERAYPARPALLLKDGYSQYSTPRYRFNIGGAQNLRFEREGRKKLPEGAQKTTENMQEIAPEPSLKPSLTHDIEKISPFPEQEKHWQSFLCQMKMDMSLATYNGYVADTYISDYSQNGDGVHLKIACQTDEQRDWLNSRMIATAQRMLTGFFDEEVKLEFVTEANK